MDVCLGLVADVERARSFYVDQVGFTVEQDRRVDETHRFVELIPPALLLDRPLFTDPDGTEWLVPEPPDAAGPPQFGA